MISLAITIYLISWLKTTCVHVLNTWSFHNILIKSLVLEIKPYIIDTQCIVTFLNNSISLISFIVLRTELKMTS